MFILTKSNFWRCVYYSHHFGPYFNERDNYES